jgi:cytochrome b561
MTYHPISRLLHLLLGVGIVSQLATSLVMAPPRPGRPENLFYEMHETVGIGLLAVVALYWLWMVARSWRGNGVGGLLPWFSSARRRDLWADIVATAGEMRQLRMPTDDGPRPLPMAVQGLGLLLALFMAASGTVIGISMGPDGHLPALVDLVKELHESAASLMWVYLIGHSLMGALHQVAGHRSLSRMFALRSR